MAVKIRLMRIGAKRRPFYRVVAVDERKKRTGSYLELLGTYNPLTEPKEIILNKERIAYWLSKGAVASDGYLRIIHEAPQRPPRKPKKEKKTEAPAQAAQPKEEAKEEIAEEVVETTSEEAPSEAPTEAPATPEEAATQEQTEEGK